MTAAEPGLAGPGLIARVARMRPDERDVIAAFRAAMRAGRPDLAHRALAAERARIVRGDGSETFVGCAFDRSCALMLRLLTRDAAIDAVAALCADAVAATGPRPWTELYLGAIAHLDGRHDDAARHHARAAERRDLLWAESNGCVACCAPADAIAIVRATPAPSLADVATHRMPRPGRIVALAVADTHYLERYGPAFLESVAALGPDVTAHLHIVDPAAGDLDRIDAGVAAGRWPAPIVTGESGPAVDRPANCALARLVRASAFLALHDRPLLVSDIDATYRAPLDRVHPAWDADVALWTQHRGFFHQPWLAIKAGQMLFAPTPAGHACADALARLARGLFTARRGAGLWYLDQSVLHLARLILRPLGIDARIADLGTAGLIGDVAFGPPKTAPLD